MYWVSRLIGGSEVKIIAAPPVTETEFSLGVVEPLNRK
jgi:hypothetical protein